MRFDSVVFADTAHLAALSCLSRLRAERRAGRHTLLVALVDSDGAEVIADRGLGSVRRFEDVESEGDGKDDQPWRERLAVMVRRLGPKHVLAPLGLLGSPQSIDYFSTLRAALSVDLGRDLLFFEERPHCLVPEALPIRLAAKGVRLPPATQLRSPRRYSTFMLRMLTGIGVPAFFGGMRDRVRSSRGLKSAFKEAADWDPQRALGPKVQPVLEAWGEDDTKELFALAAELGREQGLGSMKSFEKRMIRHALSAGSRRLIERYWLSLPNAGESDPMGDLY
ncbi:MAG: hypothetical protein JJE39_12935 [Vicinamibacteria bacterium]|nr:hypothetical protein [Vicinamibacteria bacterium]